MFDCGEIRVAPNLINTLNPTTRLPLLEDESLALSFEGTIGMFRTWVPSRFGGTLEIGCDQPGAKLKQAHPRRLREWPSRAGRCWSRGARGFWADGVPSS